MVIIRPGPSQPCTRRSTESRNIPCILTGRPPTHNLLRSATHDIGHSLAHIRLVKLVVMPAWMLPMQCHGLLLGHRVLGFTQWTGISGTCINTWNALSKISQWRRPPTISNHCTSPRCRTATSYSSSKPTLSHCLLVVSGTLFPSRIIYAHTFYSCCFHVGVARLL